MPRRRPLLTISTLVAVTLAVAGCTIPTTKDGGGYGPSGQQAVRKAAQPAPVELRSGAEQKLKSSNASWTPAAYVTAAGAKVVLDISNAYPTQHNFTFGDPKISNNLPPDSTAQVRLTAPKPGRYRFWCKYHHQEMQGWLTVR